MLGHIFSYTALAPCLLSYLKEWIFGPTHSKNGLIKRTSKTNFAFSKKLPVRPYVLLFPVDQNTSPLGSLATAAKAAYQFFY